MSHTIPTAGPRSHCPVPSQCHTGMRWEDPGCPTPSRLQGLDLTVSSHPSVTLGWDGSTRDVPHHPDCRASISLSRPIPVSHWHEVGGPGMSHFLGLVPGEAMVPVSHPIPSHPIPLSQWGMA